PMILGLGAPETATQRLNLSQAFNPMGALLGQIIARLYVVDRLDTKIGADSGALMTGFAPERKQQIIEHDFNIVSIPYIVLGIVSLGIMLIFIFLKIEGKGRVPDKLSLKE